MPLSQKTALLINSILDTIQFFFLIINGNGPASSAAVSIVLDITDHASEMTPHDDEKCTLSFTAEPHSVIRPVRHLIFSIFGLLQIKNLSFG